MKGEVLLGTGATLEMQRGALGGMQVFVMGLLVGLAHPRQIPDRVSLGSSSSFPLVYLQDSNTH